VHAVLWERTGCVFLSQLQREDISETVRTASKVLDVLDWSPRDPQTPTGPMGLLFPAPWSGALQLVCSWWPPVALRYKRKVGASGTAEEVRRRHLTDNANPSRSKESAAAAGRPTSGRRQHCDFIPVPSVVILSLTTASITGPARWRAPLQLPRCRATKV
jgi:ribosomal protein S21